MTTSGDATPSIDTVFTVITCVLRTCAPATLALDHVVQLLDAFMADVPVVLSLPKAAASGSLHWFNRVYTRTKGNNLAPTPSHDVLAEYFLGNAMRAAVRHSHMALVERIHSFHPERFNVRLLPIAAKKGNLAMFQWLFAHRTDDLCVADECGNGDASAVVLPLATKSIASLSCCLKRSYDQAIRHDQLHIAMWLLTNGFRPSNQSSKAGDAAAARGDLVMVQWLHTNAIPHCFSKSAIDLAAKGGHRHVVEYLLTNRRDGFTEYAVHNAVMGGYDDIHELLRLSGVLPEEKFEYLGNYAWDAAKHGRLALLQSDRRYSQGRVQAALDAALSHGQLHVVQWICTNRRRVRSNAWRAAGHSHLHLLQWLHDHSDETLVSTNWASAIDYAAQNGHLAIVQWLHKHRGHERNICTSNAKVYAATNGHLAILQWLHKKRKTRRWTTRVMDSAAESNRRQVVQWLHAHRTEGCSPRAMTGAANKGHLEMVIWLHEHRTEGYAPEKLDEAPLSVLKWLHLNCPDGASWTASRVMDHAALNGDHATLQFLHQHRTREGCPTIAATFASSQGHLYTVQWLYDKYPHQFDLQEVAVRTRGNGHHHIIQWLHDQQLIPANQVPSNQ